MEKQEEIKKGRKKKEKEKKKITRPDTRAKTVRLALLIFRSIPSSIRPNRS